jgi:hypothetical protein
MGASPSPRATPRGGGARTACALASALHRRSRMTNHRKKLRVHLETLRALTTAELPAIAGGVTVIPTIEADQCVPTRVCTGLRCRPE